MLKILLLHSTQSGELISVYLLLRGRTLNATFTDSFLAAFMLI